MYGKVSLFNNNCRYDDEKEKHDKRPCNSYILFKLYVYSIDVI